MASNPPRGRQAKVKPAEYSEPQVEDLAGNDDEETPTQGASGGWELGQPAPTTMYFDYDNGEVTETQPGRANVIVFEGSQVTEAILRQLGKA